MRKGSVLTPLALSAKEQSALEMLVRRSSSTNAESRRARIVLLSAQGVSNKEISQLVGMGKHAVGRWRKRYVEEGLEGLVDLSRSGAPLTITEETVAEVIG